MQNLKKYTSPNREIIVCKADWIFCGATNILYSEQIEENSIFPPSYSETEFLVLKCTDKEEIKNTAYLDALLAIFNIFCMLFDQLINQSGRYQMVMFCDQLRPHL